MAKKIIISFNAQPVLGVAFGYNILIDNVKLFYNSGVNFIDASFASNVSTPQVLKLQATLEQNIQNALFTLNTFFQSNAITYSRQGNSIVVLIQADTAEIQLINGVNPSLSLDILDVPIDTLKLKYFLQYVNIVGDSYLCNILKKNYTGETTEIFGFASIEKGTVKDHLEPIRGTGLVLELEASNSLTLEDLYTENEQDFLVQLYKNNKIVFIGYLKPDGVFQDFVKDEWRISLECIDGLGILKDLSFVRDGGLQFIGKQSALNIVYNCLRRTGISLKINTSINIYYEGLSFDLNTDILANIFLNTDRFVKKDNSTIMSCQEVLISVLDLFGAVITQIDGEWYIYKPNELYLNKNPLFRTYDLNNVFISSKVFNLGVSLGSQIDNYYPHHANANQRIEIKGSVSALRIGYKYGFVNSLIQNSNLVHDGALNYSGWVVNKAFLINVRLENIRLTFKPATLATDPDIRLLATSAPIPLIEGNAIVFKANVRFNGFGNTTYRVKVGSYYLTSVGEWSLNIQNIIVGTNAGQIKTTSPFVITVEIKSLPLPVAGNVVIQAFSNKLSFPNSNSSDIISISSIDLTPSQDTAIIGEFHTVQRSSKISSIVKENKEVFNGDNSGIIYFGAIFKNDQTSVTSSWFRQNVIGNFPILRIAAEEQLRISQKPIKIFTGDVYGYISYLAVIDINNVGNKFLPIEYSYNTKSNITKLKSLALFADEIDDVDYSYTIDYGETVKPTIKG